jgi:putative DNA primase/helicase
MRYDNHGKLLRIDPPKPLVEQMLAMPAQWPFPTITGICEAPGLRSDFSLLNTEGYDAQSGRYCDFLGLKIPRITARPSRRDAERALQLLLSLVDHFPVKDGASRSVMVGALITVVVRGCLDVVPMIVISAPDAANGKTFFVHLCGVVATGQRVPPISMSPSAEEFEKRLVMVALEGRQIILIDNISRVLQSDTLCQLVEQQQCNLRALGTSVPHIVTNIFSPFVTGINAQLANDLTRRSLRAGLDANMEKPEEKQYRDPLLLEHVLQRRGEVIAAALTVARYYVGAGRPNLLPPLASYGDWSDNVRSALVHLGLPDPCETMKELRRTDPYRMKRGQVFEAWLAAMHSDLAMAGLHSDQGLHARDLVQSAQAHAELRDALLEVAKDKTKEVGVTELGRWLGHNEGSIALDHKLLCNRENTQKPRWRLVPLSEIGVE